MADPVVKEVAVIGGGVGGLSAAIHARLRGHSVRLFERSRIGGKAAGIQQGAYRLDPGPSIVILKRIYEDLFERAGRPMDPYLRFKRLDTICRVYFEGFEGAIHLPSDPTACENVIQRVAPEDLEPFRKLMAKLDRVAPYIDRSIFKKPYQKPWELLDPSLIAFGRQFDPRLTYKQFVDRTFSSPFLRAFFYGFPSYGGQSYHSKAPGALLIPYYMLFDGVWYPEGGVAAIPIALEKLARELGVEFELDAKVVGLNADSTGLRSLRLADGREFGCRAVISNLDRLTTETLLGRDVKSRPSYSYFTVHLGIRRRLLGMAHHMLLVPADFSKGFEELYQQRLLPTSPIIYLNVTSETDASVAPEGCTNLFAVVTSPAIEQHLDWKELQKQGRKAVFAALKRFGWEIRKDEIDFERIQTPVYFEENHGNYKGSLYGPDEKERMFGGLLPLGCSDPHYKNLFYCGGSVQPGAGLPMVTLSGKFAADLMSRSFT